MKYLLKTIATLIFLHQAFSQIPQDQQLAKGVAILKGTSSLHDWTSTADGVKGQAKFYVEDGKVRAIEDVVISIQVNSIKSGKAIMDKKTMNALNATLYPYITYTSNNISIQEDAKALSYGDLQVGKVTRSVEALCSYSINESQIEFKGMLQLKMTDYQVEPPVALFGTLKTGDDLEIEFTLNFNFKTINNL